MQVTRPVVQEQAAQDFADATPQPPPLYELMPARIGVESTCRTEGMLPQPLYSAACPGTCSKVHRRLRPRSVDPPGTEGCGGRSG
jgi:hypothetical protein